MALVVLSVGIYSVAGLLGDSHRTAAGADVRVQAGALAQLKLEELKASPELGRAAGGKAGHEVLVPADGPAPFEQNPRYAWRAALKRDPERPERLDIRVDVTRTQGDGGSGGAAPAFSATGFTWIAKEGA